MGTETDPMGGSTRPDMGWHSTTGDRDNNLPDDRYPSRYPSSMPGRYPDRPGMYPDYGENREHFFLFRHENLFQQVTGTQLPLCQRIEDHLMTGILTLMGRHH